MEKMLTAKEVAQSLNVKVSTVQRCLREGKITGEKESGQWRISEGDLLNAKDLGIGYGYSGHAPGHIREALINAFDQADNLEWWKTFEKVNDASLLLDKLWNCTDIVPRATAEAIAEWSRNHSLEGGCTYAQAARALKKELDSELGKSKEL